MEKIGIFYGSSEGAPLHETAKSCGAHMIGSWSIDDYEFKKSQGIERDRVLGLVIDDDRQAKLTDARVKAWAELLLSESKTPVSTDSL